MLLYDTRLLDSFLWVNLFQSHIEFPIVTVIEHENHALPDVVDVARLALAAAQGAKMGGGAAPPDEPTPRVVRPERGSHHHTRSIDARR
jgi:hypothetical protein